MNTNLDLNGILPVNKPEGWTSFDVVAKLRGVLGIKRLGHAGTLDPMATGVLPVFVGKAAKACDILPIDEKSYIAGFRLGCVTDTQDITGKVLQQSDAPVSEQTLKDTTAQFVGDIMQLPPMYSAVSVGGKRLYELAREGKTVERQPRQRRVNLIEIQEYDEASRSGKMLVSVSKGTYIRTLINDIGEKIGCGAVMTSLERTSSAGFGIKQCYSIEQIQQYADEDRLSEIVMPIEKAFDSAYDKIRLNKRCTPLYKNGVKLHCEQVGINNDDVVDGKVYCVYGYDGEFFGLAEIDGKHSQVKIKKNFF